MKNRRTKLLAGIGLLGLGTVLLSIGRAEEPKFKRYEVIRSMGGEVQIYDTIVDASSGFTPDQYLAQLGFSSDKDIRIMELPHPHEAMMMHHHHAPCQDSLRFVRIDVTDDLPDPSSPDHQLILEKEFRIVTLDSLDQEMVEVQRVMELINLDSLIDVHVEGLHDSAMVIRHEIVVGNNEGRIQTTDNEHQRMMETEKMHGEPVFERHEANGQHKMDMVVFGGDEKDFTLVIVTDAAVQPKQPVKIERTETASGSFELYPNPASKEVAVQLSFDEKELTVITISDAQGNVVMQYDLGDFSGSHRQVIDVSRWSKGLYFVNVERANQKLVEKLVIE